MWYAEILAEKSCVFITKASSCLLLPGEGQISPRGFFSCLFQSQSRIVVSGGDSITSDICLTFSRLNCFHIDVSKERSF